jgi:signal transduction histidine kinase/ActR/RegA family two-component response regulator
LLPAWKVPSFSTQLVLVLFGLSILAMLGSIGVAVRAMTLIDSEAAAREGRLALQALEAERTQIAVDQQSATIWDDAIEAVASRDIRFIEDNLGVWMHDYFGHDESYVLTSEGQPIYAAMNGVTVDPAVLADANSPIPAMIGRLHSAMADANVHRTEEAEGPEALYVSEIGRLRGQPAFISIVPILSDTGDLAQEPGTEYLHVAVQYLDESFAKRVAAPMELSESGFSDTPPQGQLYGVPLVDSGGATVTWFSWQGYTPGRTLISHLFPILLIWFAIICTLLYLAAHRLVRISSQLEEARVKAEEMSKTKSIFLANMSHEIRTPLNGVLGMAEILQGYMSTPETLRMVSTIRQSGETLLTVLNSILDMSKIEAGKMELETVPLVPSDILAQVEALHRVKAEEKGLDLQVFTRAGADNARLGDPHRLVQILNNLLSNAIKFTDHGHVRVKLSCRPGKPVIIDISDTGVGMTEAQLSRVFESFEQADGSMARRFGGTGLGLSIVRQLVVLMGGMITIKSRPSEGTEVRVVIPLPEAPDGSMLVAKSEAVLDAAILMGKRLLVADDNQTNRLVVSEMLAQTGVKLTMVENGQDAVSTWVKAIEDDQPFDLLLLDITMPVLDGLGALAMIRGKEEEKHRRPVPAIAVTANAMPNQVADYIMGGFDTHLAKPFKQRDLLHALTSLLDSAR